MAFWPKCYIFPITKCSKKCHVHKIPNGYLATEAHLRSILSRMALSCHLKKSTRSAISSEPPVQCHVAKPSKMPFPHNRHFNPIVTQAHLIKEHITPNGPFMPLKGSQVKCHSFEALEPLLCRLEEPIKVVCWFKCLKCHSFPPC